MHNVIGELEVRIVHPDRVRKAQGDLLQLTHPVWVDDPDFDLTNHVVHHELPPGSSYEDGLDAAVEIN
ncbi:MAG: wax ester/triacylglycerol synthase domain-containing protein, partial [Pseudomonadota bacterium]